MNRSAEETSVASETSPRFIRRPFRGARPSRGTVGKGAGPAAGGSQCADRLADVYQVKALRVLLGIIEVDLKAHPIFRLIAAPG